MSDYPRDAQDAVELDAIKRVIAERDDARALLRTAGVAELATHNVNVKSYMEHWETRAQKAERDLAEVRSQRNESVMAVTSKYPNETRQETALRFINEAERQRRDKLEFDETIAAQQVRKFFDRLAIRTGPETALNRDADFVRKQFDMLFPRAAHVEE
jgi:hypothetical protein